MQSTLDLTPFDQARATLWPAICGTGPLNKDVP